MSDRFVVRTIRDGKVRVFGNTYQPRLDASQFNGHRAVFGLYYNTWPMNHGGWDDKAICLVSSAIDKSWPGLFCQGGVFKWQWWEKR